MFSPKFRLRLALLTLLLLLQATTFSQFRLLWEKELLRDGQGISTGTITGISKLDSGYLLMFRAELDDFETYPAVAFIDKDDKISYTLLIDEPEFADIFLVGAGNKTDSTLKLMANDYYDRRDGQPIPRPLEVVLKKSKTGFMLDRFNLVKVTNLENVRSFEVTSHNSNEKLVNYTSIIKKEKDREVGFIYHMGGTGEKSFNTQFPNVDSIINWHAAGNRVVIETDSRFGAHRHFYQIRILDDQLKVIKTFPTEDRAVMERNMLTRSTDRLVNLDYRGNYDIGFVTRQVMDESGTNRLAWYAFNGKAGPNATLGDEIIPVLGIELLPTEYVVMDGDLETGGSKVNRMIVSVDRTDDLKGQDLILSVADYYGLVSFRQTLKNYVSNYANEVRAWTDNQKTLYVLVNTGKSLKAGDSGIFLSKWEITDEGLDKTLYKLRQKNQWVSDPVITRDPILATDKNSYDILAIDSSDANYAQAGELVGKKINLQSELVPAKNSFWLSGTVKIGKKKYNFTKFAIRKEE